MPDGEQTWLPPMKVAPTLAHPPSLASGPQTHPRLAKLSQQFPGRAGGGTQVPVTQSQIVPGAPGVPLKVIQSDSEGT